MLKKCFSSYFAHASLLLLFVLLAFVMRHCLEKHEHVPYQISKTPLKLSLSLLLPIDTGDGRSYWILSSHFWTDLGFRTIGATRLFYLLNLLLVITTYFCSWHMTRSWLFTATMTICMVFGTQFHYSYVLAGTFVIYLQVCYLQIILLCAFKILTAETAIRYWRVGFVGMLVFMSMGFDTWLNFYSFVVLAGLFLFWYFRQSGRTAMKSRVLFLLGSSTILFVVWLPIKLYTSVSHFQKGHEDAVITTYSHRTMMLEDFVSNVFTYTFMAATNYLPPPFISSVTDFRYSEKKILAEQNEYLPAAQKYVLPHYTFYWYYYAGFLFAFYLFLLVTSLRKTLRQDSLVWCVIALALIGIGTGAATHLLIKYRGYMSVPAISYKCMPAILAVTYLISFLLMIWYRRVRSPHGVAIVAAVWLIIIYSAFTRPAMLSHLQAKVGLSPLPVDPKAKLYEFFDRL